MHLFPVPEMILDLHARLSCALYACHLRQSTWPWRGDSGPTPKTHLDYKIWDIATPEAAFGSDDDDDARCGNLHSACGSPISFRRRNAEIPRQRILSAVTSIRISMEGMGESSEDTALGSSDKKRAVPALIWQPSPICNADNIAGNLL